MSYSSLVNRHPKGLVKERSQEPDVTRRVVFRPQAESELPSARRCTKSSVQEQRPGLGAEFATSIDDTVERISSNPLAFPCVYGETRRAVL